MSSEQEIAIGLQSKPEITAQYGGLYPDEKLQTLVDAIGNRLIQNSIAKTLLINMNFTY